MPTVPAESPTPTRYTKKPGLEPLPGYVLLEPLGRGGFGEVWKCEAPGGLHKAVKFVGGGDDDCFGGDDRQLRQEFEAFQQVKAIRHPFMLPLERVELVGGELVMVMGLADRQLGDRFHECRQSGLPGIPRVELLDYLREAAEALDVIGTKYGLQHLDVKPANLFLTAGHVQVGDYGLVSKLDSGSGKNRGLTPKYAAPEVLRGEVHTRSDQYSLALVYHELLTGTFPYSGRGAQQLMVQHLTQQPDLGPLPEGDRGPVATALAKRPDDRFPSCLAFVNALTAAASRAAQNTPAPQSDALAATPRPSGYVPASRIRSLPALSAPTKGPADPVDVTRKNGLVEAPPAGTGVRGRFGSDRTPPPAPSTGILLPAIFSASPVAWLRGHEAPDPARSPGDVVRAVLAAAGLRPTAQDPAAVDRLPDGTWGCRFTTTIDPRVAKVKLELLWEQGGVTMDKREANRVTFRKTVPAPPPTGLFGGFGKSQEAGFEVVVELPEPGAAVGEVSAQGRLFGSPPPDFSRRAGKEIVSLLEGVRLHLNNFRERRKHPRTPADFPILLYPLHNDGRVDAPVRGRCRNVSAGGLAALVATAPTTKFAFAAFEGVSGTDGLALLFQIIRRDKQANGVLVTGRYRLDFLPAAQG